jgi:hypothetical protein
MILFFQESAVEITLSVPALGERFLPPGPDAALFLLFKTPHWDVQPVRDGSCQELVKAPRGQSITIEYYELAA